MPLLEMAPSRSLNKIPVELWDEDIRFHVLHSPILLYSTSPPPFTLCKLASEESTTSICINGHGSVAAEHVFV
jgi:hypothetical protein